MTSMFQSCSKLEYLNIQNFITNDNLNYEQMFSNTLINLVICINENKATKIMEFIQSRTCTIIDCSENWRKNWKKKLKIILHVMIIVALSVNMNIMEHAILNVLTQMNIK